jgi:hypothetical protein
MATIVEAPEAPQRYHLIGHRTVVPILRKRRFAPRYLRAAPKAGALTKLRHGPAIVPLGGSGAAAPSGALRAIDSTACPRSWRIYGPRAASGGNFSRPWLPL